MSDIENIDISEVLEKNNILDGENKQNIKPYIFAPTREVNDWPTIINFNSRKVNNR